MASIGDAADLRFRHAGIVFEFERAKRAAFVAAEAGKGDDRADIVPSVRQAVDLGLKVEILALNADEAARAAIGHQPPVIGGNSPISRAPAIGSS